jgi:predicted DNA-binding transcriptional regulator YafY
MYAPGFQMPNRLRRLLDRVHAACASCHVLSFAYTRLNGEPSHRTVRPLALYCWSGTWTLVAWCELRQDFRTFRLDRIADLEQPARTFAQRRGQRLSDYLKRMHAEHGAELARLAAADEAATPFPLAPASD